MIVHLNPEKPRPKKLTGRSNTWNSKRPHKCNIQATTRLKFSVTGNSKEWLEHEVKPAVVAFWRNVGCPIAGKTKVTHIDEGFDFSDGISASTTASC